MLSKLLIDSYFYNEFRSKIGIVGKNLSIKN